MFAPPAAGLRPAPGYFGHYAPPGCHAPTLPMPPGALAPASPAAWEATAHPAGWEAIACRGLPPPPTQSRGEMLIPPVLLSRIQNVDHKIQSELSTISSDREVVAVGYMDRNLQTIQACERISQDLAMMAHASRSPSEPIASALVDANHDGRPNYVYMGVDRNHDGIPDALQVPGGPGVLGHSPAVLGHGDIEEERRVLREQMEMMRNQCEKLEEQSKELHAQRGREQLLLGELAEAEAVAATAVRQRRFAEEARAKQHNFDATRIEELEQLLSNARIEKATAEARARQGDADLARISELERALMAAHHSSPHSRGSLSMALAPEQFHIPEMHASRPLSHSLHRLPARHEAASVQPHQQHASRPLSHSLHELPPRPLSHSLHELPASHEAASAQPQHHQLSRRRHTAHHAGSSSPSSPEDGVHGRLVRHHTFDHAGHGDVAHRGSVGGQPDVGGVDAVKEHFEKRPSLASAPAHHRAHGSTQHRSRHRNSAPGAVDTHSLLHSQHALTHQPTGADESTHTGAAASHARRPSTHVHEQAQRTHTGVGASFLPPEPHQSRTITRVAPLHSASPRRHGSASHTAHHPVHHVSRHRHSTDGTHFDVPFYEQEGLSIGDATSPLGSPDDGHGAGVEETAPVGDREIDVSEHSTSLAGLTEKMAEHYPGLTSHISNYNDTHHLDQDGAADNGAHADDSRHHAQTHAVSAGHGAHQATSTHAHGHTNGHSTHSMHDGSHAHGLHKPVSHDEDLGHATPHHTTPHHHAPHHTTPQHTGTHDPHMLGDVETIVEDADGLNGSPHVYKDRAYRVHSPRQSIQSSTNARRLSNDGLHFEAHEGSAAPPRQVSFEKGDSFHSAPVSPDQDEQAEPRSYGEFTHTHHGSAELYAEDLVGSASSEEEDEFGPAQSDAQLDFGGALSTE